MRSELFKLMALVLHLTLQGMAFAAGPQDAAMTERLRSAAEVTLRVVRNRKSASMGAAERTKLAQSLAAAFVADNTTFQKFQQDMSFLSQALDDGRRLGVGDLTLLALAPDIYSSMVSQSRGEDGAETMQAALSARDALAVSVGSALRDYLAQTRTAQAAQETVAPLLAELSAFKGIYERLRDVELNAAEAKAEPTTAEIRARYSADELAEADADLDRSVHGISFEDFDAALAASAQKRGCKVALGG